MGNRWLSVRYLASGLCILLLVSAGFGFSRAAAEHMSLREIAHRVQRQRIEAGGRERAFLLYVPTSYRPGTPTPLVMLFHGGGGNAVHMARYTLYPVLAERKGFIVAIPQGIARTWNANSGLDEGVAEKRDVDDIGFVRAMLADIKARYDIDPDRIYASGMSKGGMFAYDVACHLSNQIAAIAVVSTTMTTAHCNPTSPVAILQIQGSADQNVPLAGGHGRFTARGISYPPVQHAIDFWRKENRCSAQTRDRQVTSDTSCRTYTACAAPVTLCIVANGGHAWPGQKPERWQRRADYYVTHTFSATRATWRFFERHPKTRNGD